MIFILLQQKVEIERESAPLRFPCGDESQRDENGRTNEERPTDRMEDDEDDDGEEEEEEKLYMFTHAIDLLV